MRIIDKSCIIIHPCITWRPSNLEEIGMPLLVLEHKYHMLTMQSDTKKHLSFIWGSRLLIIQIVLVNMDLSGVTHIGPCIPAAIQDL